jgi:hypothetical protein
MRRILPLLLIGAGLAFSSCTCVRNPYEAGAGTNNGTTYLGIKEAASPNVLFAPTSAGMTSTSLGGPIAYSWGGTSKTGTMASPTMPVDISLCPIPCLSILMKNGDGIGGPTGNFGASDYYVRWFGHKGGDPTLDFSSMTMYLFGNQIAFNLLPYGYHGLIFFARGHGNFYVSLAGLNTGDPYSGYNFFTKGFGTELTGDGSWHQITVNFSDMTQLYGQAADIHNVLGKCYGLQFDQQPPLVPDFQLDIDYVRFF